MEKDKKLKINKCLIGIQKGDAESLDMLYDLVAHTLRFIALKYLKNEQDAEDLEQDFWANIYSIANNFSYFKNGFSYLCKVMNRMALNRCRTLYGEKTHHTKYVDYNAIDCFDEDEVINKIDTRSLVLKALDSLDPIEQIVIQLVVYEDKTIMQIAKELKLSKSKVGRIKKSAEEKLKTEIERIMLGKK